MKCHRPVICLAAAMFLFAIETQVGFGFSQQVKASGRTFDPLKQLTSGFPQSVTLNQGRRTLEFCPDETCHRFVGSQGVSIAALKDFAYLYVYFFSDYYSLPKWRSQTESRATAEQILSKPEYQSCKRDTDFDGARCVLLELSQKGFVRLEFIRGDEGARNLVREDVVKELSEKKSPAPAGR